MTTRADLVAAVAQLLTVTPKEADAMVLAVSEALTSILHEKGEAVLPKMGRFRIADRPARQGRNPRTGESISIAASKSLKFKAFGSFSPEASAQETPEA